MLLVDFIVVVSKGSPAPPPLHVHMHGAGNAWSIIHHPHVCGRRTSNLFIATIVSPRKSRTSVHMMWNRTMEREPVVLFLLLGKRLLNKVDGLVVEL